MIAQIPLAFQKATGLTVHSVNAKTVFTQTHSKPDLVLRAGDRVFVFEAKASGKAHAVSNAIDQVKHLEQLAAKDVTTVVVVTYMGEVGQRLCQVAQVNWMDLSGNACIVSPGLRVIVRGMPNLFVRPGRPRSLFAPKSARVTRLMLLHPGEAFTQRQIAKRVGLGEGYVSRVVHALEADELVIRNHAGAIGSRDPNLLLDAWREAYEFGKHRIHRLHVAARNGEGVTRHTSDVLRDAKITHAATGLSAAWLFVSFAAFRTATFYVDRFDANVLDSAGIRLVQTGENLWLAEPNDSGVFEGAEVRHGIRCVSAIQTYLDLKGHPERSKEAAEELRRRVIRGKR